MGKVSVEKTLEASADAVWAVVKDFGNIGWMPLDASLVKLEGDGPGMVRVIPGPNGEIRETLESVDDATRTLVYTIPVGVPFPVTGYRSTMQVAEQGDQAQLSWSCTFEPDGITEEQAAQAVEPMYGAMIGWIADHVKG